MGGEGIAVESLGKSYGARPVLRGISFAVAPGEIVGLLGPNGAGKSTTVGILATLLGFDQGRVVVAGAALPAEAAEARTRLAYVPQREALYPTLTARENLRFFASALGLSRRDAEAAAARGLARVGLGLRADEPIERFSVGMRRRLNLAAGLLGSPDVVLLDEPAVGVDPQSRESIFAIVQEISREGAAVLYSTHVMEEAERLCARVILLDEGRIVASGAKEELVAASGLLPELVLVRRDARPLPEGFLGGVEGARVVGATGERVRIAVADAAAAPAIVAQAVGMGMDVHEMSFRHPDLADVFFAVTGRALRDVEER